MAIKVKSVATLRKDTLDAISKQDIKEVGNLLLSAVEEIEHLHTECKIDQSKAGEDGLIDFEHTIATDTNDSAYKALLTEYQNRFSGEYNNNAITNTAGSKVYTPPANDTVVEPEPLNIFDTEGE